MKWTKTIKKQLSPKNDGNDSFNRPRRIMLAIILYILVPAAVLFAIISSVYYYHVISGSHQDDNAEQVHQTPKKTLNSTKPKATDNSTTANNDSNYYKSGGYKYLFEGKIDPIYHKSLKEFPKNQFAQKYNTYQTYVITGRFDLILKDMDTLSNHYNFSNNDNLLLAGFYRDAQNIINLHKYTNDQMGTQIRKNIIMPQTLVAMNQFTADPLKPSFIIDQNSLALDTNEKYSFVGMAQTTDPTAHGVKLLKNVLPIKDIYNKYGKDVNSVFQVVTHFSNLNAEPCNLYNYVVEFTNGSTQLYGTYYPDSINHEYALETSVYDNNHGAWKQAQKNADNHQKNGFSNAVDNYQNDKKE